MLQFNHVTISYGERPAVRDFSLTVETGQIVSIVGESGSGKTSVIRAAMGLLPAGGRVTKGRILLDGTDLTALSARKWRAWRGERIAMIFQDAGAMLNPILPIGRQLTEMLLAHHKDLAPGDARQLAIAGLRAVNLADPERVMAAYPFELSGGMCQRVGIAMAMAFDPQLLLADEPTAALDVTTQAQIVRQMMAFNRAHRSHQAIVMVTHNLGVAAYMSDAIVVMQNGRIVETGTRDAILHRPADPYTKQLLAAVPAMTEGRRPQ